MSLDLLLPGNRWQKDRWSRWSEGRRAFAVVQQSKGGGGGGGGWVVSQPLDSNSREHATTLGKHANG